MKTVRNLRFYSKGDIATLISSKGTVTIFRSQDALFAEQLSDSAINVRFLSTNSYKSVTNTKNGNDQESFSYSPYGYCQAIALSSTASGFNGEYPDPVTENYILGNGYRAFSPLLSRFICADSASPFGIGGINAYAYCLCDPINNIDPDGHGTLNLFKIARHLGRSFKGSHAQHFEKKYTNSVNKVYSAAEKTETRLTFSDNALPDLRNKLKPHLWLADRFELNDHMYTTGEIAEEQLLIAAKNLKKAHHYDRKITQHHSDPVAEERRTAEIELLEMDYDYLFARAEKFLAVVARIRNPKKRV